MTTMRVSLVVLVLILGQAGASVAQTVDDLFNPAGLHDVRLVLHSSDWQNLKNNFLDNTYYPTDLSWGGVTVRNVGIRSRGLGSPGGAYGWARANAVLGLRTEALRIEQNVALYGGAYKGLVGSPRSSGFATSGSFSYSNSMLPEGFEMGRTRGLCRDVRRARWEAVSGARPRRLDWRRRNARHGHPHRHRRGRGREQRRHARCAALCHRRRNPAAIKKQRFPDELAARLLASEWWDLDPAFVFNAEFAEPARLCDRIEKERASIARFAPRALDTAAFIELCGGAVESLPSKG